MLAAVSLRRLLRSSSWPVFPGAVWLLSACGPAAPPPAGSPVVQVAQEAPPPPDAGPAGYVCEGLPFRAGDRDYCAYSTPVAWPAAKHACAEKGGRLATFGSREEHHALWAALGPPIGAAEGIWFGLSEPQEGAWQWQDGTAASFTRWNQGEPNDDGGDEDCAEWILGTGKWNDAPCFASRPYVCEKRAGAGAPMTCTGKLVQTTASDYCFQLGDAQTWPNAKIACDLAGGTLAVLPTEEEGRLLHVAIGPRLALRSVWVGFTDTAREGRFRWVSGEATLFLDWKDGEPNDDGGNEDCAEWFPEDGKMNDLPCGAARPYLCERPVD